MSFGLSFNCCCGCSVFTDKFSREDIGDNYDVDSGTFAIVDDELVCTASGLIKLEPDVNEPDIMFWISFDAATSANGEIIVYEFAIESAFPGFPTITRLEIETGASAKARVIASYYDSFAAAYISDTIRECDITFPSGEFHNIKIKPYRVGPTGVLLIDGEEILASYWLAHSINSVPNYEYFAIGADDVSSSVSFDNLELIEWRDIEGSNTRPDCETCQPMPVWPYTCELPSTIEVEIAGMSSAYGGYPAGTFTPMEDTFTLTLNTSYLPRRYTVTGLHIFCYTGYGPVYLDGFELSEPGLGDTITLTSLWETDDPGDYPPGYYWQWSPPPFGPLLTPPHTADMICGTEIEIPPYGSHPGSTCVCSF